MKFQKIYALGHREVTNLWAGEVEITEKIDGSQFRMWRDGAEESVWHYGTKRTELQVVDGGCSDKLFNPVVRHMEGIDKTKIPSSIDAIFGETLAKPRHNTLKYNVVPKGHLALWGGYDGSNDRWLTHEQLRLLAHDLCVDVVPLVGTHTSGIPLSCEDLDKLLEQESFLGGPFIEGLVFKNYTQDNQIGDEYIPFLAGKFVSEKFKEQHVKNWKPKGNAVEDFMQSFATEARWNKAIQHLRDDGALEYTPRDIGALMKEIHKDIDEEEVDTIKDWFYNHYIKRIKRTAGYGFPEFYKRWLVESAECKHCGTERDAHHSASCPTVENGTNT
jgi:hypothetical protein